MAISFIGSATGTTSATMPAGLQAGDLIIVFAGRASNTTPPTIDAAYTSRASYNTGIGFTGSCVIASKTAASSTDTVGTFANAHILVVFVYRGAKFGPSAVAGLGFDQDTYVEYPANGNIGSTNGGTSWGVAVAQVLNSTASTIEHPPSGMIYRGGISGSPGGEIAVHDTNGGISGWSAQTVFLGGGTVKTIRATFEISPIPTLAAGSGVLALSGADATLRYARRATAAGAAVGLTGSDIDFVRRKLVAEGGALVLGTDDTATITANFNWFPMNVRRGDAWVQGRLKIFDGTNWVKPHIKRRVGSSWVVVS